MKKQIKVKEPIRLRTKKLSNGNESLYLDIYTDGKRDYEFLKLYIIQERTKEDSKCHQVKAYRRTTKRRTRIQNKFY